MCGINGVLRLSAAAPPIDRDEVVRTRDAMERRGPDGDGLWFSPSGDVALGHRRLAILDLSPAGAQPFELDGRYHISFNGEIYDFRALREELAAEGVPFRSESDTEVILALWRRDGVGMLRRLRGMYALAIWDDVERTLLLARDPFGIKPLYYSQRQQQLRFSSQVKALLAGGRLGELAANLDLGGLAGFLYWGSVPEPLTLHSDVRALPAGHFLLVRDGVVGEPQRHYSPGPASRNGVPSRRAGDASVAAALADSVAAHLVSDVPVAVFLSAGLDSALITALAARQRRNAGDDPLTTLTARFPALTGTAEDEGPLAVQVAKALGTVHLERSFTAADLREMWPSALAAMDQPSIDGLNTFVISRVASEAGFKVVLSGLGGDELFGSYPSFRDVPRAIRVARAARRVPMMPALWSRMAPMLAPRRPKAAGALRYGDTFAGAYLLRRGLFLPEELPGLLGHEVAAEATRRYDPVADAAAALDEPGPNGSRAQIDPWLAVHQLETCRYLRNQLLRDADWAAMASSVELRVPLVDARLRQAIERHRFEPARSAGKAAVVREAAPELPAAVFGRKKSGFYVPLAEALELGTKRGGGSRVLAIAALRAFGIELPMANSSLSQPELALSP